MKIERRHLALFAFCLGAIASQYLRNIIAVIAPQLTGDLSLTPSAFGWLSTGLFLSFALVQIPVGLAFDRFGVRWPTAILMAVGCASLLLFGTAQNVATAIIAQVGIGLACAPIFTGLMIYVSAAFDTGRNLQIVTIASAVGICGSLLAGTPLCWLTESIGWRGAVSWSAVLLALPMLGIAVFVGQTNPRASTGRPLGRP